MTPDALGYGRDWQDFRGGVAIFAGTGCLGDAYGDGVTVHPIWWHQFKDGDGFGDGRLPPCWTWYTNENGGDIPSICHDEEDRLFAWLEE